MTPEQVKLHHETFKHLTTLSKGAIVVASALLRTNDRLVRLIASFGLGAMALVSLIAIVMMFGLAQGDYDPGKAELRSNVFLMVLVKTSLVLSFGLALVCFGCIVFFRIRNDSVSQSTILSS